MVKCSVCGRNEAFYRRRDSGERLCMSCLRKSLERRTRRAISESVKLKPKSLIALLAFQDLLIESITLSKILHDIERKYSSNLLVITSSNLLDTFLRVRKMLGCEYGVIALNNAHELSRLRLVTGGHDYLRNTVMKTLNLLGVGVKAVVTPVTIDDLAELSFNFILEGTPEKAVELINPRPPLVHAFKYVMRADIHAYAYSIGLEDRIGDHTEGSTVCGSCRRLRRLSVIKPLITELSFEHPELIYRFIQTLPKITEGKILLKGMMKS